MLQTDIKSDFSVPHMFDINIIIVTAELMRVLTNNQVTHNSSFLFVIGKIVYLTCSN